MKLPNVQHTVIPRKKVVEYLLSSTHQRGQGKADFFSRFGFAAEKWEELAQALIEHANDHEVTQIEPSPFGLRYVIEGTLRTPDQRNPHIRTVWFIESGEDEPRFVTAYPLRLKGG